MKKKASTGQKLLQVERTVETEGGPGTKSAKRTELERFRGRPFHAVKEGLGVSTRDGCGERTG